MRIAFVTNICPHYRVATFELLARYYDIDFYFFSAGDDWYWQHQHGTFSGRFRCEYLPGVRVGATRITPSLPKKLFGGRYQAIIKCINGRFALPITYSAARMAGIPFILWTGIWMRLQTPLHRALFPATKYIYTHSDAIVVYGQHVKEYLLSERVEPARVFVAPHAIDNAAYNTPLDRAVREAVLGRLNIDPNAKVVLYLGRLEDGKGLPHLIDAFATLDRQDAVLVLAGSGSQRHALEELARARGVGHRIRFAGHVPVADTPTFYSLAWVFVLPSVATPVFKEPWGLVVNEAMNQGVPVVASDAVGAAAGGLVEDGVNGFVVPERDSIALAQVLRRLLDDEGLRHRMGESARRAVAAWNNERMVTGFREAIESTQGKKGAFSDKR